MINMRTESIDYKNWEKTEIKKTPFGDFTIIKTSYWDKILCKLNKHIWVYYPKDDFSREIRYCFNCKRIQEKTGSQWDYVKEDSQTARMVRDKMSQEYWDIVQSLDSDMIDNK